MKEDTLYEHHRFTVDPKQEPIRIDKFLIDRIEKVSRNRIQQGIKKGYVLVNEEEVKANYKVSPGDIIIVSYPKKPKLGDKIQGEDIDLNIVYEDPYLMVVDKPYGQVVHPGIGNMEGTLVHAIVLRLNYLLCREIWLIVRVLFIVLIKIQVVFWSLLKQNK